MAPEQCLGAGQVDGQADVYSLGVLLYEMLCGQRPFKARGALEVMNLQLSAMPVPLRERGVTVDARLADLVECMLAKHPAQRPTMIEVLRTLEACAAGVRPRAEAEAATSPFAMSGPDRNAAGSTEADLPHTLRRDALEVAQPAAFLAGPPISNPRHFFGRRKELKRIFNLWRQTPLQNAAVIGPRRSGKTSLLLRLQSFASSQPQGNSARNGEPLRFVFVDFQDPRLGTREGLLRHLLQSLGLPPHGPCDLEMFISHCAAGLRQRTIILLDEIDLALERYSELDGPFWDGLRALATNQVAGKLGFVLASHEEPQRLATGNNRGSPFFNIFGYTATLGPLQEAEARELVGSSPRPFPPEVSDWILKESGGWPILLQILCREYLLALEEGDSGDDWQAEARRQLDPFRYLFLEK